MQIWAFVRTYIQHYFNYKWYYTNIVHTVKENAEALVVATKETGLEVNADKTKYMIMSRDKNAG